MRRAIKITFCTLLATAMLIVVLTIMGVFDRATVRKVLSSITSGKNIKPDTYHDMQGFSPGKTKSKVEEDFNRYHFYLAPDPDLIVNSDPQIYFRQDYDYPEPEQQFDEDKYWQEHPLQMENYPPEIEEKVQKVLEGTPQEGAISKGSEPK